MKINRRKVLLGAGGFVGVSVLGVFAFGRAGLAAEIESVIRRRLDYLKLDEAGVRAFAKDQVAAMMNKHIPTWVRIKYHFRASASPLAKRYFWSNDRRSKKIRAEDLLVSTYLLSSDFFRNGGDESRTVGYVAFFDPVAQACSNPFARRPDAA